ncbi:cytochrome P450 [Actinoplanes teichomyceticus]|uniref:Cytochrome P450 n=1 Tax=Actinoplanes teichomyceticus TaxID=1867 RepID=A0A561WIC7_ACTTI|nr:cytochrome P450 [Actinoplanes teichomyceticus]TWG23616.1 cytochrome P450 [Actinoplanes teichomyceticus]GIF11655.1 cytochrome P-450 like protein [Actinoplanes teichomyceticus]
MSDNAATVREYDLFTPEAMTDPDGFLHRVRAESPLAWLPQLDAYLLTRYADVNAALRDKRMDTANMARVLQRLTPEEQRELAPVRRSIEMWMGHTVPADHARFQQLLKRYFTPAMVDRLRPRVRAFTHELLDTVARKGQMDVVRDLAYPLPANVIAELLGMPVGDREQLQAWSRDIVPIFGDGDLTQLRQAQRSMLEMHDYLRPLAAERRRSPRADVLSTFIAAEAEGVLTEDEAVANCVLLLFAGHETTANLIANGLVLLFENPDQLARLRANPDLMPQAVEEMLRCDGPAGVIGRVTTAPVELAGHPVPAGKHVYLALMAANRDPEVFDDPDVFDITRQRNRHLSFGMGTYYCLGAALARMETDECLRILLDRCPDLRPAYRTPDRLPTAPIGHRLATLPVTF